MNNILSKINIQPDYELEFRIEDIDIIKGILKRPNLKEISFEDSIVTTYKPKFSLKYFKYRSTHIINSINDDKYEKKELIYHSEEQLTLPIINEYYAETSNPLIYQTNNNKVDSSINNKFKKIKLYFKYSRETITSKFQLEVDNIYRKIRKSYLVPTLNFRIDLTFRYFPILPITIEEMKRIHFHNNQIENQEIDGYNLKIDLEFEYLNSNINNSIDNNSIDNNSKNNLINEYHKLLCFLSNYDEITFSLLTKMVPYDFTKTPQVNILTNNIINQPNSKEKFVWSEKMDGVRYLLIFYKGLIYTWQNVEKLKYYPEKYTFKTNELIEKNLNHIYILDCELIDDSFYVFDCYTYLSQDIRYLKYIDRLKHANNFIKLLSTNLKITILNIKTITDWPTLINYALEKHNNTDGIVLHSVDPIIEKGKKEWPKLPIAYKLKPTVLNTVDFLYIYVKNKKYYQLYLASNYDTFIHALRDKSIKDTASQEIFNYDMTKSNDSNYFILFDCPYFEDMWKYEPNKNDELLYNEQNNMNEQKCNVTCNIMNEQNNYDPTLLHHLIVESQYLKDEKRWKPIRIRSDKEYPNNYNVGLTNVSLLFDLPRYSENIKNNENIIIKSIRTYIWDYITINADKYLPFSKEPIILLDYQCNSEDIPNYYTSNVQKIFAISDSPTTLVNYVNALKNVYYNQYPHIINMISHIKHPRICLNVFLQDKFKTDIILSNDYILNEINVIFINNLNNLSNVDDYIKNGNIDNNDNNNNNIDNNINNTNVMRNNNHINNIEIPNLKKYVNDDAIIIYVYVGEHFNEFYTKYSSQIIHYFNPMMDDKLIEYLYNLDISKQEINNILDMVNCVIMKVY